MATSLRDFGQFGVKLGVGSPASVCTRMAINRPQLDVFKFPGGLYRVLMPQPGRCRHGQRRHRHTSDLAVRGLALPARAWPELSKPAR